MRYYARTYNYCTYGVYSVVLIDHDEVFNTVAVSVRH
jgi:hypothetical protein